MTREQAISTIKSNYRGLALPLNAGDLQEIAESDVAIYTALGMLKLDESKSAQQKFDAIFSLYRLEDAKLKAHEFLAYLDEAGLKIVEK